MSGMKWAGPFISPGSPYVCMAAKRWESEYKDSRMGNPNEGLTTVYHALQFVEMLIQQLASWLSQW